MWPRCVQFRVNFLLVVLADELLSMCEPLPANRYLLLSCFAILIPSVNCLTDLKKIDKGTNRKSKIIPKPFFKWEGRQG